MICRSFWLIYADFSDFNLGVHPCIVGEFAHALESSVLAEIVSGSVSTYPHTSIISSP